MASSSSEAVSSSVPIAESLTQRRPRWRRHDPRASLGRTEERDMANRVVAGIPLVLMAATALAACGPVKRPDGGTGLLPVGAIAPDFLGHDITGKTVHLSEQRGH